MPVLIKLIRNLLPGKLTRPKNAPKGIPKKSEIKTADPEIRSERTVTLRTSGSSVKIK